MFLRHTAYKRRHPKRCKCLQGTLYTSGRSKLLLSCYTFHSGMAPAEMTHRRSTSPQHKTSNRWTQHTRLRPTRLMQNQEGKCN